MPVFLSSPPTHRITRRLLLWAFSMALGWGPCDGTMAQASRSPKKPGDRKETQSASGAVLVASDQQTLARGQRLFEQNCSACHNFRQKGIGPNLARATSEVSAEWLKRFIRNAPELIRRGDVRATRLFREYNQAMPAFTGLSEAHLEALLAYIHHNRTAAPTNDGETAGTDLKDPIPARIPRSGLRLLLEEVTTAPRSTEKGSLARLNKMGVLPGKKDRLFIVDLRGTLYEMGGKRLHVFMNMASHRPGFIHSPGLATGFGSFAFHPDFNSNGLLYTTHTEKAGAAPADFAYADSIRVAMQWVLTEWKLPDPAAVVFSGVGRELMRINVVSSIHGVQEIAFNPLARPGSQDYGLLYIGVGDGGATENGYPFLCRNKNQVWGKVLRVDPLGTSSKNGHYGIPVSNPYARGADPTALGEIYCRGFRNPNRICWTSDGKMLITDIGQAHLEELNLGVAAADYGWPDREGTFRMNPQGRMDQVFAVPDPDAAGGYTNPVIQYDHDEGRAISGGFVYAGTAIPLLAGKYLFGDVVNGRVFSAESSQLKAGEQASIQEHELVLDGKVITFQALNGGKKTDLRFGEGIDQTVYLYTKTNGKIYQVVGCSPAR